jgi:hypothetical protein
MSGPFIVILVVFALAAAGVVGLLQASRRRAEVEAQVTDVRADPLVYAVPTGQDPAVPLAALERHGITAVVDPSGPQQVLLVDCPRESTARREEVRAALEEATASALQDGGDVGLTKVRFEDEH